VKHLNLEKLKNPLYLKIRTNILIDSKKGVNINSLSNSTSNDSLKINKKLLENRLKMPNVSLDISHLNKSVNQSKRSISTNHEKQEFTIRRKKKFDTVKLLNKYFI
jgi:hypothetical protein